ncbi:MAG: LacI family DNA-binding transcriptional regulator [Bacteroidota bacterium]|nr:LacI family DNA-binding transcriptional regulator [Bacteroidota bacterium]
MDNVTIKMLAKELNLSTAAISKALRDSHEISDSTKQRVLELANRMNYIPNAYAGSLRRRKSNTIAVVLPEVADSFFSLAINGIESVAREKGYHVLIYLTHESFKREQDILKEFQSGRVDGILMSLTAETASYQHICALEAKNIAPLVFFDRVCDESNTAKIMTDDFESGYKATKHLIECGCKKIAVLSISNYLSISSKRLEGYKQALQDHSIPFDPINLIYCGNDADSNYRFIRKILHEKDRPDGILATVEKLTTKVYLACRELSLRIPDDIKIVSFSNLSAASLLNPSLTTITQPAFEIGKAAATVLFKSLDKKSFQLENIREVLPSELIVRGSTVSGQ